jgi:hypothetical protein
MPGPTHRIELTPEQERRRKISLAQAVEITGLSKDTLRRRYGHLIKQLSPRRRGMDLGDALDIGANSAA